MDNITYHVLEAKKLGMSYGKYMSIYGKTPQQIEQEKVEKEKKEKEERAENILECVICGKQFSVAINKGQKYCSDDCRRIGQSELALKRYYKSKGIAVEDMNIAPKKQKRVVIPHGSIEVPEGYVALNCKMCGKEFVVKEGRKNKIYCGAQCRRKASKMLCYAKKKRELESAKADV